MIGVRAPGRVNLIGDHTDYNDGFCLPLAIDRECVVTGSPRSDGRVTVRSLQIDGDVDVAADGSDDPGAVEPVWGRFVGGVVRALAELGRDPVGFEGTVSSTVPAGSGLSSSSALSIALTLAIAEAGDLDWDDLREVAHAALRAEVLATGVPGGLMDQLCSLFGVADHAVLIDCRSLSVTPVALPRSHAVLVVHSGIARELAGSAYAERRAACEAAAARLGLVALRDATFEQVADDPIARHVVTENQRVLDFVSALDASDVNALGPLLLASHVSLRDDYRVSTPELDLLVDLLVDHGAIGARLTGAGFGGCVVALVQRNHADDCAAKTVVAYQERTGALVEAFVVHAVDGRGSDAMKLRPAERLRPGRAPVAETSDFAPVASAESIDWTPREGDAKAPQGGGHIVIELGGRWERRADDDDWRKVVVPDNFGHDAEFSAFYGPMWYRRKFADPRVDAPDGAPQRARLRFAAVDYFADVWLNDELLGHHEGYFAPFGFDVTDKLRQNNEVLVRVQDPLEPLDPDQFFFSHKKRIIKGTLKYHDSRPGGLPGRMSHALAGDESPAVWTPEWGQSMTTAGIVGPVSLLRTGDVAISNLFVTPLDHETGSVQVAVVLENHDDVARETTVHLVVEDEHAAFDVTLAPGVGRIDVVTDLPGIERWEPVHSPHGTPELHELVATAVIADQVTDRRSVTFGLRSAYVVTDADGHARHLEVNGRPVYVKAVNYIPWQHFAEAGRAFYDRDMRLITEAHGNSIGVHAHLQSPYAYAAADAAGVLTFQDFPLQWFYDSGSETNPGFVEEAQRQIAEMAYLLHSHPSVVYYACHNEPLRMFVPTSPEDDTPERDVGERHLDAALFATLRSIEDSRHVHEASGIGDDVHSYSGSLTGRNLYRVSELPAWFVSEYGFWTVGPQAGKYGDAGWPPTTEQMREWVSRLSFIGSTVGFAGMPDRYDSLGAWAAATETYGAALAKHQTEWFRIHRGAPFMGYRWHFWADWWGYAGGGLVDIERAPKQTYAAWKDASRPVLVTARTERSVYEPGRVSLPVFLVNDTESPWRGPVQWEVRGATSYVIAPDASGFRIGLAFPDDGVLVAVPHEAGETVASGTFDADAPPELSSRIGDVDVDLEPGTARTVTFRWGDQSNFVHLHCPAGGASHPPGLSEAP